MVMAMLGRPPQHALLRAALGEKGEDELEGPAGREGAVREIAMVAGGDREHTKPVERHAKRDRRPCDPGPDRRETAQMHDQERNDGGVEDVVIVARGSG